MRSIDHRRRATRAAMVAGSRPPRQRSRGKSFRPRAPRGARPWAHRHFRPGERVVSRSTRTSAAARQHGAAVAALRTGRFGRSWLRRHGGAGSRPRGDRPRCPRRRPVPLCRAGGQQANGGSHGPSLALSGRSTRSRAGSTATASTATAIATVALMRTFDDARPPRSCTSRVLLSR
jgi:hypothetical protein